MWTTFDCRTITLYSLLGTAVENSFDLLQLRRRNVLLQAVLQAFEIDATHSARWSGIGGIIGELVRVSVCVWYLESVIWCGQILSRYRRRSECAFWILWYTRSLGVERELRFGPLDRYTFIHTKRPNKCNSVFGMHVCIICSCAVYEPVFDVMCAHVCLDKRHTEQAFECVHTH